MDDLISRQAKIDAIVNITVFDNSNSIKDSIEAIEALPSAQRKGKWLEKKVIPVYENGFTLQSCKCSECDRYDTRPYMYYFSEPNFCSYCGAGMKGGEDETD